MEFKGMKLDELIEGMCVDKDVQVWLPRARWL